jgi:hypothetical protein
MALLDAGIEAGREVETLPTTETSFGSIRCLSAREENELCVSISGQLIDLLDNGTVTHSEIRNRLREFVQIHGNGHTDDFFIDLVVNYLRLAP